MLFRASRGYILEGNIHGKTLHGYKPKKFKIEARFASLQKCAYNTFHFLGPWLHAFLYLKKVTVTKNELEDRY